MAAASLPRISVIVPLYNKGPFVLRCLRSIATQTEVDFEAIVVDDGSSDDGPALATAFAAGDSRFRIIHQANAGPGAARNRGLAEARAGLVAFLDADDEWLPTHLAEGAATLDSTGAAAVSNSVINLPGEGTNEPLWRSRGLQDGPFRVTPELDPVQLVYAVAYMCPCSTVARRDIVLRHGGYYSKDRCRYSEDAHLWLRLLLHEEVFFSLPARVKIWRDASSLSSNLPGMRPLEPFLAHPEEVEDHCPAPLLPLLAGFYAIRAFKTASLLGLHGQWRQAAELRARFRTPGDWRLPYFWTSLAATLPPAGWMGAVLRKVRG
jgi:hypothetical protein